MKKGKRAVKCLATKKDKAQTSAKIEYALLILGSSQRLIKIVGTQGVKNSTMLNPYGGESVEASEVKVLQKIEFYYYKVGLGAK